MTPLHTVIAAHNADPDNYGDRCICGWTVGSDHSRTWEKWRESVWVPLSGKLRADDAPTLPVTVLYIPEAVR